MNSESLDMSYDLHTTEFPREQFAAATRAMRAYERGPKYDGVDLEGKPSDAGRAAAAAIAAIQSDAFTWAEFGDCQVTAKVTASGGIEAALQIWDNHPTAKARAVTLVRLARGVDGDEYARRMVVYCATCSPLAADGAKGRMLRRLVNAFAALVEVPFALHYSRRPDAVGLRVTYHHEGQ